MVHLFLDYVRSWGGEIVERSLRSLLSATRLRGAKAPVEHLLRKLFKVLAHLLDYSLRSRLANARKEGGLRPRIFDLNCRLCRDSLGSSLSLAEF